MTGGVADQWRVRGVPESVLIVKPRVPMTTIADLEERGLAYVLGARGRTDTLVLPNCRRTWCSPSPQTLTADRGQRCGGYVGPRIGAGSR
jgi:hypothetical protein